MRKPLLGLLVGGILGVFDGLTALVSAPETAPQIVGIVTGSCVKGLVAGLIIGFFARRVRSMRWGILFGFAVGLVLAFLIALAPDEHGGHYWVEIMLPGSIVGMIVGYATQRYGGSTARA